MITRIRNFYIRLKNYVLGYYRILITKSWIFIFLSTLEFNILFILYSTMRPSRLIYFVINAAIIGEN